MSGQKTKKILAAFAIAMIVTIFASVLALLNPFLQQQLYLSNFLYTDRPTDNQVIIVSIDDQALSSDGLGKFADWCRSYYADVIDRISENDPKLVAVDIFFINGSKGICQKSLTDIFNAHNPAVELDKYSAMDSHPDDRRLGESIMNTGQSILLSDIRFDANLVNKPADLLQLPIKYIQPIDELMWPNVTLTHNRFLKDGIDLIRSVLPTVGEGENTLIAFPLQIAATALNMPKIEKIEWSENSIDLFSKDKTLQIPLSDYQMLINFTQPSKKILRSTNPDDPIRIVSFLDIYNDPGMDLSFMKDKIVLLGLRASNSGDNFFTPIDSASPLPGVEIHAQAIQTILDEAWLYTQPFWSQLLTIAALALLSVAIIFVLPIAAALPLMVILIAVYAMLGAPLLFKTQGLILNLVYPPLTVVVAAITGYAYRYLTEFKQKTKVTGALGQYVNKDVAEKVLEQSANDITTGGENKEITVLFTDIKGFTTISENLRPESVVALLNEYFEVMTEEVVRQGGTVDKFEGDALMAFFEDKPDQPPHAVRAAKSSLKMREALQKLMAKWKNDGPLPGGEQKPQIDFRLGLSSGEAIVGNIGSSQHIQYTVIGDIVNLGSRLEGANKKYHTSLMLAEATYAAVQNEYECRFLDVIRVKGKDKPVKTYELLAPKGLLSPDQTELIQAYNKALVLYFERNFPEALEVLQNEVLQKWPADYLANLYAGRCELLKRFPPAEDWDFVNKMTSK